MGWGVEQEETFPQRLEALLGRRVLNASVSSYGTARELQALRGVDLSALEWLVVQYSRNDVLENAEFELSNGRLAISSRDDYEAARASIERATAYFPGKHVGGLVGLALRGAARWESTAIEQALARYSPAREAHLLLRALSRADLPWARLRLLFVEINGRARNRPAFANALRRQLAAGRAPLPAVGSYVLSSHELVGEEHYYVLDDHMRPEGHRRIAEAIARRIADE
jgi:hypothetical protein